MVNMMRILAILAMVIAVYGWLPYLGVFAYLDPADPESIGRALGRFLSGTTRQALFVYCAYWTLRMASVRGATKAQASAGSDA